MITIARTANRKARYNGNGKNNDDNDNSRADDDDDERIAQK
jgi:hypothetical protein